MGTVIRTLTALVSVLLLAGCKSSPGLDSIIAGADNTIEIRGLSAPAELADAYARINRGEGGGDWRTAPLDERRVMAWEDFGEMQERDGGVHHYAHNQLRVSIAGDSFESLMLVRGSMFDRLDLSDINNAPDPDTYYGGMYERRGHMEWWFLLPQGSFTAGELANIADYLLRSYPDQQMSIFPHLTPLL